MAITVTDCQDALKDIFLPGLKSCVNNSSPTLKRLKRKMKGIKYVGRKLIFGVKYGRLGASRAGSEYGTLQAAGTPKRKQVDETVKFQFSTLNITDVMLYATKEDRGAFVNELDDNMQDIREEMSADVNRQLWGLGSSVITTLAAVSDGANPTLYLADARMIEIGDRLDVLDTSHVSRTSGGTQLDVTGTDTTVTPHEVYTNGDTTASTAIGDYIVIFGSHSGATSYEMVGLQQVVSDTATLHGLDVATYKWWKSKVFDNSGTLRDLTLPMMQNVINELEIRQGKANCIYMSYGMMSSYLGLVQANRRYMSGKAEQVDGGWTTMTYTSSKGVLPMVIDRFVPGNKMFFLNESELLLPELAPIHWVEQKGNILQRHPTTPSFDAVLAWYLNQICINRQHQALLGDLNETTA